jgi:hypothetical protein
LVDERNPGVADAGVKQIAKQRRLRPVAHGVMIPNGMMMPLPLLVRI